MRRVKHLKGILCIQPGNAPDGGNASERRRKNTLFDNKLHSEAQRDNDLVILPFPDAYRKLSLKTREILQYHVRRRETHAMFREEMFVRRLNNASYQRAMCVSTLM